MRLEVGDKISYEDLNWTVTGVVLNSEQEVVIFDAIAFNGSFYIQKQFTISDNNQRGEAA